MRKMSKDSLKISLKNYGLIEDAEVEFDPGLNVIIGESGNGKSTLLRGLYGTIYNDSGTSSVRSGCVKSETRVEYLGHVVEKTKDVKGESAVVKYNFDGKTYEKLGGKPLDICLDAFNMKEIELTKTKEAINFSAQFEKPFLVDESPSKIFEILTVSDSNGNVLKILTDMKKDLSEMQKSRDIKGAEINTLKTVIMDEKKEYESLEGADELLSSVLSSEKTIRDADTIEHEINETSSISSLLKSAKKEIDLAEGRLGILEGLPPDDTFSRIESLSRSIDEIGSYITLMKNTKTEQESIQEREKSLSFIDTFDVSEYRSSVESSRRLGNELSMISDIASRIKSASCLSASIAPIIGCDLSDIEKSIGLSEEIRACEEASRLASMASSDIEDMKSIVDAVEGLDPDRISSLSDIVNKIEETSSLIRDMSGSMSEIEKKISDIDKSLSEIPVCPTCGRPMCDKKTY